MLPFGFDGFHVWRHRVVNIESYKKKAFLQKINQVYFDQNSQNLHELMLG
jgi:hypothetical protein